MADASVAIFFFDKAFELTGYFVINKDFVLIHACVSHSPISVKMERLFQAAAGGVSNPLIMIDCFTTGIVNYKQGNYL